jgi:tRNA(Ile)-lysidine synthase
LTPKGLSILVAVSGGPDSLCLLDVLARQAVRRNWRLGVACLDHGLRPESRAEARRVHAEAEKRGLPFYSARLDVKARARRRKLSIEAAAREARYGWLTKTARQQGFDAIATGHTADDQAETVLLRLLRGAGSTGLAAMRVDGVVPGSRPPLRLLRPLLTTTRAEVEAYIATRKLNPSHDASNADPAYTRNRVRRELLPVLEAYNPNIRRSLARLAEVSAGEADALDEYAERLWAALAARPTPHGLVFDREAWSGLSRAARRLVLRRAARALLDEDVEIGFDALEAAVAGLEARGSGRQFELGGGVTVTVEPKTLRLSRMDPPGAAAPGRLSLRRVNVDLTTVRANPDSGTAYVDLDVLAERLGHPARAADLEVRVPRRGDRFQPLGLNGRSQLLSDFLSNARVPRARRVSVPLVLCAGEILWVVGHRPAHWARVTEKTLAIGHLLLAIEPSIANRK